MSEDGDRNFEGDFGSGRSQSASDFQTWEREIKEYRVSRTRRPRKSIRSIADAARSKKDPTWSDIRKDSDVSDELLFGMFAANRALEVVNLIESKHKDYGAAGIIEAPFGPIPSLITRLHDKVARASNLTELGKTPNHESLRETFLDIAGYGLIGLMVLDKQFPEK